MCMRVKMFVLFGVIRARGVPVWFVPLCMYTCMLMYSSLHVVSFVVRDVIVVCVVRCGVVVGVVVVVVVWRRRS